MIGTGSNNISETLQVQAKTDLTNKILDESSHYLKGSQLMELNKTLNKHFQDYEIFVLQDIDLHKNYQQENEDLIDLYINNKRLEGCSPRTLSFYEGTIRKCVDYCDKHISDISTQDIREFLNSTQSAGNCSNATIDNLRRNLNTFFNTISNEGYIQSNPMARIKKIKSPKRVKKPFTDLEIEKMRDELNSLKEHTKTQQYYKYQKQALFELLLSSGIRLNECVQLNKSDINLEDRSFIVFGKGGKERICYFSSKAQFYLERLLTFKYTGKTRKLSDKEALFVDVKTGNRLLGSGVERNIRNLGRRCGVKAHPHKFRRTFATTLVNKGVPIEQIKELLGHANLDTTMIYAIVDQEQIRYNHNKYAGG